MNKKILLTFLITHFSFLICSAQMRINMGADSPLRKLQIAEMAVNNLYVGARV